MLGKRASRAEGRGPTGQWTTVARTDRWERAPESVTGTSEQRRVFMQIAGELRSAPAKRTRRVTRRSHYLGNRQVTARPDADTSPERECHTRGLVAIRDETKNV